MSDRPGQYPPPIKGQSQPPGHGQYPPPITQGQNPPTTAPGQYPPPSAPGQYPPPSAPGQYPPAGAPGQYPPPGAPGQYPPPGAPGQYPPPGAPGQYPPHGAPGQYPPPGAPGQYPPPGAPGQYPPPGAPGQYPPPGAPGQYPPPGAPGQYPPPGAPGQYPPPGAPGQYPPPGAPGQYPPSGSTYPAPGAPGHYPPAGAPGQFPPHGSAGGIGPQGQDTVDSDGDNYLCTKRSNNPIEVQFVNRTNSKVTLYWVNEKGKFKKITKMKRGHTESVDTFATHPFVADMKDGPGAVINGNSAFVVENVSGGNRSFRAEITNEPHRNNIRSTLSGTPASLMFSNRTHKTVSVKWIDTNGHPKVIKELAPKKAWLFNSCEGHYFTACERGRDREEMDLNYGWYYLVTRSSNPGAVKKVLITEPMDDSSSSSSSD